MVAQQRQAVFNLALAVAALSLFMALIPFLGLARAQGGFALLGFTAIGPLFMLRRKGRISIDERDRSIFLSATQITFGIFWLLFAVGLWTVYYLFRNRGVISVDLLPLAAWLAWSLLQAVHSAVLLILYQRS